MPETRTRAWKLDGKFGKFTGVLNGVYIVKDGVVQYSAEKVPNVLINHYGAKPVDGEAVEAVKAKAEAELRVKIEAEVRAKIEAENKAKAEAATKGSVEAKSAAAPAGAGGAPAK